MKLLQHKDMLQVGGGIKSEEVNEDTQAIVGELQEIYQLTEELVNRLDRFEDDVFAAMKHR